MFRLKFKRLIFPTLAVLNTLSVGSTCVVCSNDKSVNIANTESSSSSESASETGESEVSGHSGTDRVSSGESVESASSLEKSSPENSAQMDESKIIKLRKIDESDSLSRDINDLEDFFGTNGCIELGSENVSVQLEVAQIKENIGKNIANGKLKGLQLERAKSCLQQIEGYFDDISDHKNWEKYNNFFKVFYAIFTSLLLFQRTEHSRSEKLFQRMKNSISEETIKIKSEIDSRLNQYKSGVSASNSA